MRSLAVAILFAVACLAQTPSSTADHCVSFDATSGRFVWVPCPTTSTIAFDQSNGNTSRSIDLHYGGKYGDDSLALLVLPRDPDHPEGFNFAIACKDTAVDRVIVEVYYWSNIAGIQTDEGRPLKIMRHQTQVVDLAGASAASMGDLVPMTPDKVVKIALRLVSDRGTVELWNLGDEPKETKQ